MAKNYFWPRGAQQRIPRFARIYQTLAHRIWVPPLVLPSAEQGRATLCPVSLALALPIPHKKAGTNHLIHHPRRNFGAQTPQS